MLTEAQENALSQGVGEARGLFADLSGFGPGPQDPYEIQPWRPAAQPSSPVPAGFAGYRPYGGAKKVFEDRSELVGVCGPAGTGKSRGVLEKVHLQLEKYPGSRALFSRKTRESMSETVLQTYEDHVLPRGHAALDGGRRSHRQVYRYSNGSEAVVCGLDDPQRIMSGEYDTIATFEAVEASLSDFEMLSTRLRAGVVPYNQHLFDCNPSFPLHWINMGARRGDFPMHPSFHEDNPTLWEEAPPALQKAEPKRARPDLGWPEVAPDGRIGRWTARGQAYMKKLDRLTGARHARLRMGRWAAAEGAVYDEWDASVHVQPMPEGGLPRDWRRVWGVDFGFTKPFCWASFAVDEDGRLHQELEIYMTRRLVADHAKAILAATGWRYDKETGERSPTRPDPIPLPSRFVADHDAEGRATLEEELGIRTDPAMKKPMSDGLQAVSQRLRRAGDGLPRIVFHRGALVEKDSELEAWEPRQTVEEFDSYTWDEEARRRGLKEVPRDENNHGMDLVRYVVAEEDGLAGRMDPRAKDVPIGERAATAVAGIASRKKARRGGTRLEPGEAQWAVFAGRRGHKARSRL